MNGIYKHWKEGDLYRVYDVTYDEANAKPRVSYYKCDEHGVFQSVRDKVDSSKIVVNQPFNRPLEEFNGLTFNTAGELVKRFTLIKRL